MNDLRELLSSPSNPMWRAWRFLDAVMELHGAASEDDQNLAVDCLVRLANEDPDWAVGLLRQDGPPSHALSNLLGPESRMTAFLGALRISDGYANAIIRARVQTAVAKWHKGADTSRLFANAWAELCRVSANERDRLWRKVALDASASCDFRSYRALAEEELSEADSDFWRSMFLPGAIATAAKHGAWDAFEAWVERYGALALPLRRGHDKCAINSLQGLRALELGRDPDAEAAMRELLENAKGQEFISNDDVSALPKRLRKEGKFIDLCAEFDRLIATQDWRQLPEMSGSVED